MFKITKRYTDLKAAHRQWRHQGHCKLIHGECWTFDITLSADKLDECGFVLDFGKLRFIKEWLDEHFDHTLLLNQDDPWLSFLKFHLTDVTDPSEPDKGCVDLSKIVEVPNCGAEGLARFVLESLNRSYFETTSEPSIKERNVRIVEVTVFEDTKNSATYSAEA